MWKRLLLLKISMRQMYVWCVGGGVCALFMLMFITLIMAHPVVNDFLSVRSDMQTIALKDRRGIPLTVNYQGRWNTTNLVALYAIPDVLKKMFLFSEDKGFYEHGGVDWAAKIGAVFQNMRSGQIVRGASTVTEQVVRMMYPRPRNVWSKWMECVEALLLEQKVSKANIYEFYLNQVPYAANRRGVAQAAQYYFNRDISTLSTHEMLALVVLARAPSSYDLYTYPERINGATHRLSEGLYQAGILTDKDGFDEGERLVLQKPTHDIYAQHFARYVRLNDPTKNLTSLDSSLQGQVQNIIDMRLKALKSRHVENAGALVVDHYTGEVLAWVVGGATGSAEETAGRDYDTVTTPRQPGSAMKPFLYAAAIEKGWSGATLLDDSPLAASVGTGLHRFRNYSNSYYGPITLREALGNSLNIPALLTIQFVGVADYLSLLQKLGFQSLGKTAAVYDEGLALGNGEVTLLEMTRAYAAIAHKGIYSPLRVALERTGEQASTRLYQEETTSILSNILSDPWARRLEFGADSVLNLPVQTAAKTGTSTDCRDAWVFGYNDRYVVGIWMGNLDRTPMNNVTGSTGPALAMRSIFSLLNKDRETKKLYLSPHLVWQDVCVRPSENNNINAKCPSRSELFVAGKEPHPLVAVLTPPKNDITMIRPTEGLQIAYDPRIPPRHQKFRFELGGVKKHYTVEWILDGQKLENATDSQYLWPVERGQHSVSVKIASPENSQKLLGPVHFLVK